MKTILLVALVGCGTSPHSDSEVADSGTQALPPSVLTAPTNFETPNPAPTNGSDSSPNLIVITNHQGCQSRVVRINQPDGSHTDHEVKYERFTGIDPFRVKIEMCYHRANPDPHKYDAPFDCPYGATCDNLQYWPVAPQTGDQFCEWSNGTFYQGDLFIVCGQAWDSYSPTGDLLGSTGDFYELIKIHTW